MSASSSVGDFDLNAVKLRKPLEFADGSIQMIAYEGATGVPSLAEVLASGFDASGQDITGVDVLAVNTQIQLAPTGNTINFQGEINQVAAGYTFSGNQMTRSIVYSGLGQSNQPGLVVCDNNGADGLAFVPNSTENAFNPIVNAGDIAIVANSVAQNLSITKTSAVATSGLRITDSTVTIGAGGVVDTPSNNVVFNSPANKVVATSVSGMVIQSPDISPTGTLQVKETTTNRTLTIIPMSDGGQYNPLDTSDATELVAYIDGATADNGSLLAMVPHSGASCGIRMAAGTGGDPTNAYLEVGCGGVGVDPSQRIRFDNATSSLQMSYTNLAVTTGALPAAAGAAAGVFLPVTINGVVYKIALLADA